MSAICTHCHTNPVKQAGEWCRACQYKNQVAYMHTLPEEDQDWEFAVCEECGTHLDDNGLCRNQNCGASPDVGKDWI